MIEIDYGLLERLYKEGLSFQEIAKRINVSLGTIKDRSKLLNLNTRVHRNDQTGNKNPSWKGGTSRATICRTTKRVLQETGIDLTTCQKCGRNFSYNLNRHHKDGNRSNNDPSNLVVLCVPCHNSGSAFAEHGRDRDENGRFKCSLKEMGL